MPVSLKQINHFINVNFNYPAPESSWFKKNFNNIKPEKKTVFLNIKYRLLLLLFIFLKYNKKIFIYIYKKIFIIYIF